MRNHTAWRRPLVKRLRPSWSATIASTPEFLADVELGLYALETLASNESAFAMWVLLTGYLPVVGPLLTAQADACQQIGVLRHYLLHYKSRYEWVRALNAYRDIPSDLRGYDVDTANGHFTRRDVVVAANRWHTYEATLTRAPSFRTDPLQVGGAGSYLIPSRRRPSGVRIPKELPLPPPTAGHQLTARCDCAGFRVAWDELLATASWMDQIAEARGIPASHWRQRLERVRLDLFDQKQQGTAAAGVLTIDGMLHLVGMISAGKSTLMDVLAVYAARSGRHVTLVVGDVVNALRRVDHFLKLGVPAAPILGTSNRKQHVERLHRVLVAGGKRSILSHQDPRFDFVSTACILDGLRDERVPLALDEAPCRTLIPAEGEHSEAEGPDSREKHVGCPFWSACPRHRAARDLVDAQIWVGTPASLVYSRVPAELNRERLRYAELVYRRSDLVIFDEADQVQVQLDAIFSPGQTLIGRAPDSWLDHVLQWKDQELTRGGRNQFGEAGVDAWNAAADVARTATNRLYALLRQNPRLQAWIERDYFSEWTLSDKLARHWSGARGQGQEAPSLYIRLRRAFDHYLSDPLNDNSEAAQDEMAGRLSELTRQALPVSNRVGVHGDIAQWIRDLPELALTPQEIAPAALQLEFILLLAVLSDRLNYMFHSWKQVEVPLNLDGSGSILFHRPPDDYAPVIPESPMGNILGFQYLPDPSHPDHMGDLRFFRCAGVGRWILQHFHELFAADGVGGPNVMLLSGTSWAGTSPRYHVQVPVGGILRAPDDEVEAIAASTFAYTPFFGLDQKPITVSGKPAGARAEALSESLSQLVRRSGLPGAISRLEQERDTLPRGRQRVLLLVGSYEEARQAYATIIRLRDDWRGQVLHLVADDDTFESGWNGEPEGLRRGEVDKFAETGAWLLIAPLMAIERGHNILNDEGSAALGAVYFLVRPHPRPDDITLAIQAINHWAIENADSAAKSAGMGDLDARGQAFRTAAYRHWRHLLRLPLVYSTLPAAERDAVTWSQLVSIWQVIGRLVRGGCPARVYFCDAAFAPRTAASDDRGDTAASSLLVSMRNVLRPYCDPTSPRIALPERELVKVLYGPFYDAISRIVGVADASL